MARHESVCTGGSGFVGRHLLRALAERGAPARALCRSDWAARIVVEAGGEPVRGDLLDEGAMAAGMGGCDVVFHSAARLEMWRHEREQRAVNVEGTRAVLRAAGVAEVGCLLLVSAAAVLCDGHPVVGADERAALPVAPCGAYARTKAEAERLVLAADREGLRTVAVRPPLVWGLGDTAFLPELVHAVRGHHYVWIDGGHRRPVRRPAGRQRRQGASGAGIPGSRQPGRGPGRATRGAALRPSLVRAD